MTFENLLRSLNAYRSKRPFKPFSIRFFGGETLTVSHPEAW